MKSILFLAVPACARNVKVLSYSGPGAGMADVNNQHMCFEKDIIPGVTIRGTKKTSIKAGDLDGYDLLLMPGGSPGTEESHCDASAIRAFVKAGGGYYGTCAGAFAGCSSVVADPVTGRIEAWNATFAPGETVASPFGLSSAVCHSFNKVAIEHNTLTNEGQKAFPNQKTKVDIDHHNGPAISHNSATVLATFTGGTKDGYASIVGDTYGKGKVMLVSPHPEHPDSVGVPMNCDIVTYMAAYAAGVDVSAYITI
jgi:glutamine amidotransferase-like uncharacterized protein